MKNMLIIVDVQKDFYHPNGALYVKDGEKVIDSIGNIINKFDEVIFTIDWHPYDHCSFLKNEGQWPVHCVEYTEGASIPIEIVDAIKEGTQYVVYTKGSDPCKEEYGAFQYLHKQNYNVFDDSNIVICGLAGDYCVLETLKNILKLVSKERVSLFLDGIKSIDGGEKLNKFIQENNINIYDNK